MMWYCCIHSMPCSNDKRYDDAVFADRFFLQLTMFKNRLLMGLSWLIHAHNSYETDTDKIIASFCRISYCFAWFFTVELNYLSRPNDKIYDDVGFADRFRCQLTMYEAYLLIELSRILDTHISSEIVYIKNHQLVTGMMRWSISHA